jgi:YegS/Rv2252/BmrU family lipid kinase
MNQVTESLKSVNVREVPTALIVNTKARRGQELYNYAQQALFSAGVKLVDSYPLVHGKALGQLIRSLVERGVKAIILGSGDGTISSTVDYLVNNEVVLGVLPFGTANDFARTLQLPCEIDEAIKVILGGCTTKIDLGIVNQNYYVNVASVGVGAAVVEYTSNDSKKLLGPLAYPLAAAQAVLEHQPFTARLTFSNQTIETQAMHIAVANGRFYGGGVVVAPSARIDDNELIVTIFEPMNPTELFWVGMHLRDGQYVRHPRVRVFRRVRHLKLDVIGGQQQQLNIDGELMGHTPAEFGIAAASLRVFVPHNYGDSL